MKPIATVFLAALLLAAVTASRAEAAGLELTACPGQALHAYPLAPGTRFQSLVVPGLAVANRGAEPAELTALTYELLDKGVVVDTRRLAGETLATALKGGASAQLGPMQMFPFQFCDGKLLGPAPHLSATATLAPGAGGLVTNQTFGWKGSRGELRITAVADRAGGSEQAAITLAIRADTVKTPMVFPLAGRWFVAVAGTPHGGHRWGLPEAFAYDIVRIGADDRSFRGQGTKFADYYAYGAPVLAAGDGVVAEVVDDQPEDPNVLRRPGESFDAYGDRAGALQMALLKKGDRAVGGNSVLIDHGNGEYSLYAHLQPGGITVKPGQRVKAGQPLGKLGSSGNTTEPHLHFQVCDGPSALHRAGVPLAFTNVELPYADGPRAIQAGDIVVTH
jgi:murein DD-endopeptidase MepM/ murein hydrolase activator NlpD